MAKVPKIKNLPKRFNKLWEKCVPLLKQARPDDLRHTKDMVESLLSYRRKVNFDLDVLVPAAMMHDISHSGILEEHFKHAMITERLNSGELIHMSAGAKIAKDLLKEVDYNQEKVEEVIDIINTHYISHSENVDKNKVYDTVNEKIFHDIEILSRFTQRRMNEIKKTCPSRQHFIEVMRSQLELFFYPELKRIAENKFMEIENMKRAYGRVPED